MRSASLVLLAYGLMLVLGVVWSALPIPVLGDTPPDVAAVTAGYLGLTARRGVAAAVGAAVITGYLADLLAGAPRGLLALTAGIVCVSAIGVQRRILVRGWALTAGFAAATVTLAALASVVVRLALRGPVAGLGTELWGLVRLGVAAALLGPAIIRLYRRVDAAFARTHRERDHALEGWPREVAVLMHEGGSGGVALPTLGRRLRWVLLAMLICFGGLVVRLWQLQVMRGDRYRERTVSNVVHERFLPSIRGRILDRDGVPLADNRPAFNLYATPKAMTPALRGTLKRLIGLSDEELEKIDGRLAVAKKRKVRDPVLLLEDISRERAALVDQERYRWPDVEVRSEPYRHYPQGDLAAHLVGYMTQMTAEEASQLGTQGYSSDELIGRYGLESMWENYLRGKKGKERYAVDARGRRLDEATAAGLIQGDRVTEPVAGYSLVLTLDADLQRIAERAVAPHPAAAVAVVEVATGKVLALVSKPSFDPNVMTGHLTKAEAKFLEDDPRKPFIDKALRVPYPPGSTFKFITTIAALEDGQGREDEPIVCKGSYQVAGDRNLFDCTSSHGRLDLVGAIQHSCNVYFWSLAERVGLDRLAQVANEYGFGSRTGLGLNGDAPGRIPTVAWYEKRGRFVVGYTINGATGQGDVELTVMQLAMAYAALANGGTLFVPQVVDRVARADGATVIQYQPQVKNRIDTPPEILDLWKRGTYKVVNEPGGTAYGYVTSDVITIAGKTGTAQVAAKKAKKDQRQIRGWSPSADHAWFAGVAPADTPEVAIVVLIEHGGPGGKVAGPVAKAILEGWATRVRNRQHGTASGPLVGGAILGRLRQIVATWQLSQRAAATPAPGPEDEP